MNQKKYYPTAVALYITYFILGIAVTIMGQYKHCLLYTSDAADD